jgi:hypothetical protein
MSEPVWKVKSIQDCGDGWLYYEIEDHRGSEVEMSVIVKEDGEIYEVLITTEKGAYMFFEDAAAFMFHFVEKELLGSRYLNEDFDTGMGVSDVDDS